MTTIRLYGILGKKYGQVWRLNQADTPRKAVDAIDRLKPGFRKDILAVKGAFRVRAGAKALAERHLDFPVHGKTISITPLYGGAAGKLLALGEAVLGVVLVIVGLYFGVPFITLLGASLILGGVAALLSPTPSLTGTGDAKAHRPSYQFTTPVNTVAQGAVVPVGIGEFICGSAVASEGIDSQDVSTSTSPGSGGTGGGGPGGYSNVGGGLGGIPIWSDKIENGF